MRNENTEYISHIIQQLSHWKYQHTEPFQGGGGGEQGGAPEEWIVIFWNFEFKKAQKKFARAPKVLERLIYNFENYSLQF